MQDESPCNSRHIALEPYFHLLCDHRIEQQSNYNQGFNAYLNCILFERWIYKGWWMKHTDKRLLAITNVLHKRHKVLNGHNEVFIDMKTLLPGWKHFEIQSLHFNAGQWNGYSNLRQTSTRSAKHGRNLWSLAFLVTHFDASKRDCFLSNRILISSVTRLWTILCTTPNSSQRPVFIYQVIFYVEFVSSQW